MQFIKNTALKPKIEDSSQLGFGRIFTDYMFMMDFQDGEWKNRRITPYSPIPLDPAAKVLHYSQELFEGLKAYRSQDDRILLFRAKDNFRRLNEGCERIGLPTIDVDDVYNSLIELLKIEQDWIPSDDQTSLYIRPTIIGTDPNLAVNASQNALFYIILSPSGAYYANGLAPTKIFVQDKYVRAVRGGTGTVKTGGNYAASLKAGIEAADLGYDQVLWLDGVEQKYIDEVGSMNIFFLFKDELATPTLHGSVLNGITRRSVIELAKELGLTVNERQISIDEIYEKSKNGELLESFGSGTAAVISPVGQLRWEDKTIIINNGNIGDITLRLYEKLTDIQTGKIADTFNWVTEVL